MALLSQFCLTASSAQGSNSVHFHQFYIDDILVIPSWEEAETEEKAEMVLHIDPGTAFGTGMHETTQFFPTRLKAHGPLSALPPVPYHTGC